jgi:hypothetical protein
MHLINLDFCVNYQIFRVKKILRRQTNFSDTPNMNKLAIGSLKPKRLSNKKLDFLVKPSKEFFFLL